jgi:ATP-dependent Lon protease
MTRRDQREPNDRRRSPEMRNDTAFMDRLHAYAPGWDFPKLKPAEHLTDHFDLVTDFLSECWTKMREGTRVSALVA